MFDISNQAICEFQPTNLVLNINLSTVCLIFLHFLKILLFPYCSQRPQCDENIEIILQCYAMKLHFLRNCYILTSFNRLTDLKQSIKCVLCGRKVSNQRWKICFNLLLKKIINERNRFNQYTKAIIYLLFICKLMAIYAILIVG